MRAHVDTPIEPGIPRNLENQSPLVLIFVDTKPALPLIDGTEDSSLSLHGSSQIHGGIVSMRRSFAEAEGLNLADSGHSTERHSVFAGRGRRAIRVVKAVACGEPQVLGPSGRGIESIFASSGIPPQRLTDRQGSVGKREFLRAKGCRAIDAAKQCL